MKRVLVCGVQTPYVTGGAEILVQDLRAQLAARGFAVDVVNVPFRAYPPVEIPRQALAWRLLDVLESWGERVDLVIPTKFPSWLVRHPLKVAWLFHQHREAYDLLGSRFCGFSDSAEDRRVVDTIRAMDQSSLAECRALFAISKNVAGRLSRFNSMEAEALYPPPRHVGRYRSEPHGDYLFYAGRLEPIKRLDLVIDALARTKSGIRLKLAGHGPHERDLRERAARCGLDARVDFLGFVSDEELLALYAGARAAIYAPLNEDYGYVTVEAFLSRRPVVTTDDSGGPLEFVEDGASGIVTAPEADALADGFDRLAALPAPRLRDMGAAGHARVADIGWDAVIERLTAPLR
jgi:glycosyltransferase involved in cell wall biosynthesis